jgi:hypothetical protein
MMEGNSLETFANEKGIAFFLVSPRIHFPSRSFRWSLWHMHVVGCFFNSSLDTRGVRKNFVDDVGPFGF